MSIGNGPQAWRPRDVERGKSWVLHLTHSFITLHSRIPFEDYEELDEKCHLMRFWLSVPSSQPLLPAWAEYWGDVRAGSVRGGVRGSAITQESLEYEKRQAEAMGMPFTRFKPTVIKEEMCKIVAAK